MVSKSKKSNVNDQIRENLQRVFDEALNDEVPQQFIEMIKRLSKEKADKSDGA